MVPMGAALRVGAGVQWRYSERLSLAAAYEFFWGGDMDVDQGTDQSLRGRVAGSYENTNFSFFTLSVNWRL